MKLKQISKSNITEGLEDNASHFKTSMDEIKFLQHKLSALFYHRDIFYKKLNNLAKEEKIVFTTAAVSPGYIRIPETGGRETNFESLYTAKIEPIVDKIIKNIRRINAVVPKIQERIKSITVKGHTFVFTQFRDSGLESQIERLGGRVTTSVSSKTDFVIAADPSSKTGKVKQAIDLGIRVMSRAKLIQILR